jgi:fatty-acid desaturase
MRFLYKRQPANELQQELREVRHVMCSGSLVFFDLLFYSFLFALLILPAKAGMILFGGLYVLIYLSLAGIFVFIHKTINSQGYFTGYRQ